MTDPSGKKINKSRATYKKEFIWCCSPWRYIKYSILAVFSEELTNTLNTTDTY